MSEDFPVQLAGFRPGSVVAGYRLEAQVGAGGMAMVFRARDERLDRLVALKILAPALTADSAFRRRFIAESRAAAAVDDPHIIPVHEAGEAEGALFIAMRFVPGGDLRRVLEREGPLAPGRAAEFISPVASALDAAHAAGLVHRDVKPANILVDARTDRPDHVYLSDFGVSKGATSSVSLTGTGHFLGTPAYSAPEQIQGQAVDGRTDQYALACMAYQMLTGEVPFEREQGMAVLLAHLSEPPPSVCARRPDLPAATDHVLARALAKVPENRYRSCRDFADALREALGLAPYHPRSPSSAPGHPQTQIVSPPPGFPVPAAAGTGKAAVPADLTAAVESGRLGGEAGPPAGDADGPASGADIRAADVRPISIPGSGGKGRPAWRLRRLHAIMLVGAVLVAAAIVASVLASSPSSQPTLTYSQFLHDVSVREVSTVEIAYEAGGTSSGTLTDGTSYTVVIPPQAGHSLLDDLAVNNVQVTGASSSGSQATLTYSQFMDDASHQDVTTVDLAPSAGGMSSGTLVTGVGFTVVIPPQARQSLLTELHADGVQVRGPSSSGK